MRSAFAPFGLVALGLLGGCGGAPTPARAPTAEPTPSSATTAAAPTTTPPSTRGDEPTPATGEGAPISPKLTRGRSLPSSFAFPRGARLQELGAEGQWLLGCAPRDDGAPSLTLWTPGGEDSLEPRTLTRLLGTSASGRFVAFERDGRALLWDAATGGERSIPSASEAAPLLVAFGRSETSLVVLEKGGQQLSLVSIDASGELMPRKVLELDGPVFAIDATAAGFVLRWTDRAEPRLSKDYCARGGFPAFPNGKLRALRAHRDTWLLDEGTGEVRRASGFVGATGSVELHRAETGALRARSSEGERELASEACGARILGASEDGTRFVVVCEEHRLVSPEAPKAKASAKKKSEKPKLRFPIRFVGGSATRPLDAETMRTGVDAIAPGGRFVGLRLGAQPSLLDFATESLVALPPGHVALSTSGGFALLRQGKKLLRYPDGWSDDEAREVEPLEAWLTAGPYFATPRLLGSLEGALTRFDAPEAPLLLTERGWLVTRSSASTELYVLRSLRPPSSAEPEAPPPPPLESKDPPPASLTRRD